MATSFERILLTTVPEPVSHYCHGVRAGDRLWISGMVGIGRDGSVPSGTVAQFELALSYIDAVLKAAGGGPENVVKVQVFLTDVSERAAINPIHIRYFGQHRPASTLVEVSALVDPRLTVEIEAEAVLG